MVELSAENKSRVFYHLGMGSRGNVQVGDIQEVEQATSTIIDDYTLQRVLRYLDTLDALDEARDPTNTTTRFSLREQYGGDFNRSVRRELVEDIPVWDELYLSWTDKLAELLAVQNYQRQDIRALITSRQWAPAFVATVPGVADTSVASKLEAYRRFQGGFGFQ